MAVLPASEKRRPIPLLDGMSTPSTKYPPDAVCSARRGERARGTFCLTFTPKHRSANVLTGDQTEASAPCPVGRTCSSPF